MSSKRKSDKKERRSASTNRGIGKHGRSSSRNEGLGLGPVADACAKIVEELLELEDAFSFSAPVTELWSMDELPEYFEIIREPMDLGTIMTKIRTVQYVIDKGNSNGLEFDHHAFARDVRLVFENCKKYNQPKTQFHRIATNFLKAFEKKYREIAPLIRQRSLHSEEQAEHVDASTAGLQSDSKKSQSKADHLAGQRSTEDPKDGENQEKRRRLFSQKIERNEQQETPVRSPHEDATVMKAGQESSLGQKSSKERENGKSRVVNTSSVSSEEQQLRETEDGSEFAFVSTAGMEKKRGRKSTVIMTLEEKHAMLMRQRKLILESMAELERRKNIPISFEEKARMCEDVANLDFVRMRTVVDIIVKGIDRPDILEEEEVELDIDLLDNRTFRDVQVFLENPSIMSAQGTLRSVEAEIASLEGQIVNIRYRKIGTTTE